MFDLNINNNNSRFLFPKNTFFSIFRDVLYIAHK